jgi:hypothetical protein
MPKAFARFIVVCGALWGVLLGGGEAKPQAERTLAQLRKEADHCAWILGQFAFAHDAWFENGLEKAERHDITGGGVWWPPPEGYSWRVAILPAIEKGEAYDAIHEASGGYKPSGKLTDKEVEGFPELKRHLARMPEWFSLERLKDKPGYTIFRRVRSTADPQLFILVESSELVPWYRGGDDLILDPDKPLPKMGGNFPAGFFALCGDGKVRYLRRTLSDKELRQALTTGGGVTALRVSSSEKKQRDEDIRAIDFGVKK